jgi:AcrR family transcriptional regulator
VSTSIAESSSKGPTRRLPREQRREVILAGATRAFGRAGFAATSMSDVASASGITQLIVYRHFESKADLYRAVLEAVSSQLGEWLDDERSVAKDPSGLGLGARSVLEAARRDPDGFQLLWRHAAREPQFSCYASELRERALAAVERSIRKSFPSAALPWAAHAAVGYLVESVLVWLEFGDPVRDDLFVHATNEAMKAGVRAWSMHCED